MAPTRRRADRGLERRVATAFGPEWLAAQRWFRSKDREIEQVALADVIDLSDPDAYLLVLDVRFADASGGERYLVAARGAGNRLVEPQDGDGIWASLATSMLSGGEAAGRIGNLAFEPTPAAERLTGGLDPGSSPERRLQVEQSNTSVVVDDRLVLKLYRLLTPGPNPEVEIGAFLTAVGFRSIPTLAGTATYVDDGDPSAAAKVEELVPAHGDAWDWAVDRLAVGSGAEREVTAGVGRIGVLTRTLHEALASRPEAPGFPAREATADDLEGWQTAAMGQLDAALDAVSGEARQRLVEIAPVLADRLSAIAGAPTARVSRIHGDLHLGQLLRTDDGFVFIDFEGEPARSLDERRGPSSPLRDVAGLLRSLDYAARTAQRRWPGSGFEPDRWLADARPALLDGYHGVGPGDRALLDAFEVEKACYEVRYEAANRPDWTWLPIAALERMAS